MEIITADIGGTHARFALASISDGKATLTDEPVTLKTSEYDGLASAWQALEVELGRDLPRAAAIAIAAPVTGDTVRMTNNDWVIRPAELASTLNLDHHVLLNDFEAVGYAVAAADDVYFSHICGPDIALPTKGVCSIVGPGTGLGVAVLVRDDGRVTVLPTEGGHSGFAPVDDLDDLILAHLRAQHDRVSVERVVSGPGLRTIFLVLAKMMGLNMPDASDKELWTAALQGHDALSAAALDRFCQCLGSFAGDVALTHGPGPVVIAGGIGHRLADILPHSRFAERFAAKGRYEMLLKNLPVKLITYSQPGLLGAATALARRL